MSEIEKEPLIRFKGFTEAWKQRELSDYLAVSTEKNKSDTYSKNDVLSVSGEYGIVNQIKFQGRSFAGVSVSNYGIVHTGDIVYTKSPLSTNPYGIIKTNKGNTGIVSTLYAVYHPKKNAFSDYIQMYFELHTRMNNYMRPLVNKGAKNDMKVSSENALKGLVVFPNLEEQKRISHYLSAVDHLITLHQLKCDLLEQTKKTYLQKLFPRDDENVPEMRFAGFEGNWVKKKLGSCFTERSERSENGELISVTINSGVVKASELDRIDSSSSDKSNYKVVKEGDIAYNSMRMWQGASGYCPYNGILSPAYTVLVPKDQMHSKFFSYNFKRQELIWKFRVNSQGLTSDTWNLKFPAFSNIKVKVPSYEEQLQISNFLSSLDICIIHHQKKLATLKTIKQTLLNQMFI